MPDPRSGPLLVAYYEAYLRDQDVDVFRLQVSSRYLEGTITKLAGSADLRTRRAAVFALGLVGSFRSNTIVARALRDHDATIRGIAENALWAIWFRADTPENNDALEQVSLLIGQHEYGRAVKSASQLIEQAPHFAEAYNQRAIAEYHLGDFQASANDCRLVLERNAYHIGALAGLAKCLLRLDRRGEALDTLRRSSRLQPFNDDLRHLIAVLEDNQR